MSYLSWHVGMKVVCIAGAGEISARMMDYPKGRFPQKGGFYTIREVYVSDGGNVCLRLREIDNRHLAGTRDFVGEPGFRADRFRPVQTRKTDISVFTAMLNPSKRSVDA